MQFVLSMLGHRVRTVDPGLASREYQWGSRSFRHEGLNAAFRDPIEVHGCYSRRPIFARGVRLRDLHQHHGTRTSAGGRQPP